MTGVRKHIRGIIVITALLALSLLAVVICVGIGTIKFSFGEVIRAIFVDDGSTARLIVWNLRFPRILTGGLVGVCLALSGCVLQGVMRNNLASPSTIGVTGGASFVGYLTLVAFPAYSRLLPIGSIIGAFVTTMLIYALAYQKGVSPVRMILSGMAVSALFGAFNDIIKTLFAESLGNASGFLVGGLNGCGWKSFQMILPYALCGMIVCLFLPSKMNILMLGDETANSLGLRTELFRFILIAVSSLLIAPDLVSRCSPASSSGRHPPRKIASATDGNSPSTATAVADPTAKTRYAPASSSQGPVRAGRCGRRTTSPRAGPARVRRALRRGGRTGPA